MNRSQSSNKSGKNPYYDIENRPSGGTQRGAFFAGIARFVLLILIGTGALMAGVGVQGYLYLTKDLPSVEKLKEYRPPIAGEIFASNGQLIGRFATEVRYLLAVQDIPNKIKQAFVAAEDKTFWEHNGVDPQAIVRAVVVNIKEGKVKSGASTITQQVAKNLLLTPEKTISRKIKEAILALRIEEALTKEEILALYLNEIFLGSNAHGIEAAARVYFAKHVGDLSIAECAMLAGLPQAPAKYSPKRNMKAALERRSYALRRMLEEGYITQAQYDKAKTEKPVIREWKNPYRLEAPDFTEHVRRYVEEKYGPSALTRDGYKVYTTVDLEMTEMAHKALERGLEELDRRQGFRGPLRTLNVKEIVDFLGEITRDREEPLRFGDLTEGVVTEIDDKYVYVHMGSYVSDEVKREYVGRIEIDPRSSWWVRTPYVRADMRTRNFEKGDLPFQVGDVLRVRLIDPNVKRRELYLKRYGTKDPEMKNYKVYTEDMLKHFPLEVTQEPMVQAAVMLRENTTGYVRVLLGGRDFSQAGYNRATQAHRQPGSSFKPIIYAAALNHGFTCADVILDEQWRRTNPETGEVWEPKNYDGGYLGPVSFREALEKSRNVPTVKILDQISIENAKRYARKMGYHSPLANNLTMALGSTGVLLEEQVAAYSVFPNKGFLVPNEYITKIVDRDGNIVEEHRPPILLDDPNRIDQPRIRNVSHDTGQWNTGTDGEERRTPILRRTIDEGTAYIMTDLLKGVVERGTATVLKKIVGRPDIAGKTGTTNDYIDAWFMGFSPDFTCGVWVGFDNQHPLGRGESGGKAAAPIWGYVMNGVLEGKKVKEFPHSDAVEPRKIDPRTGLVTTAEYGVTEIFKVGSAPPELEAGLAPGARYDPLSPDLDQF